MRENKNQYYLSPQQKRSFRVEQLGYNPVVRGVAKVQNISVERLSRAMSYVMDNQKMLRSVFPEVPGMLLPCQEVNDVSPAVTILERTGAVDFHHHRVNRLDPMVFELVTTENGLFLTVSFSAFVADCHSLSIFFDSLNRALTRDQLSAPEEIDYLKFGQWQEEILGGPDVDGADFWTTYPQISGCRFAVPRANVNAPKRSYVEFAAPEQLISSVQDFDSKYLEALCLTTWTHLLAMHSEKEKVTLGYSCIKRNFPEIESIIGSVGRVLPVTIAFNDDNPLGSIVDQTSQQIAVAEANQYLYNPEWMEKEAAKCFPVAFEFVNLKDASEAVSPVAIFSDSDCSEVALHVCVSPRQISFGYTFEGSQLSTEVISVLNDEFNSLLQSWIVDRTVRPSQLTVAWKRDRHVNVLEGLKLPIEDTSAVDLFRLAALKNPLGTAVEFETHLITYAELDAESSRIAAVLISRYGVRPHDAVAVVMARTESLPVILVSVMKAGAFYVPVDPADASSRVEHIMRDSKCVLTITDSQNQYSGIDSVSVALLKSATADQGVDLPKVDRNALAYMIYTSGTTGKPKGVPISHGALANYVMWIEHEFKINANDSSALISSHAFDLGYTSLWGTLLLGGRLCLVPDYLVEKPEALVQFLLARQISFLKTTPSLFHLLVTEAKESMTWLLSELRMLFLGGEKIRIEDVLLAWSCSATLKVINHYGPTECTIGTTAHLMDRDRTSYYRDHIVLGRPSVNSKAYILDKSGNECAPGIAGELHISGPNVSTGYFNNEAETSEKFKAFPRYGETLYNTGDRCRLNLGGEIEFIGRIDQQVKINGYRVEIGEVESAVRSMGIVTSAVIVCTAAGQLSCYYVSDRPIDYESAAILLTPFLPQYMIPARWLRISRVPITANGKTDYSQLPAMQMAVDSDSEVRDMNDLELVITMIWKNVLGVTSIDLYDNFFYLGGDSIKAIQIASRLFKIGYDVKVKHIFENPTVAKLAAVLRSFKMNSPQGLGATEFPITPVMSNFFENHTVSPHYYNHSVLLLVGDTAYELVVKAFDLLFATHDSLRMILKRSEDNTILGRIQSPDVRPTVKYIDLSGDVNAMATISRYSATNQSNFSLEQGVLAEVCFFRTSNGNHLLVTMHHLITDGVSWNIMLDDLRSAIEQLARGNEAFLVRADVNFADWAIQLKDLAFTPTIQQQLPYWMHIPSSAPSEFDLQRYSNNCYKNETTFLIQPERGVSSGNADARLTNISCSLYAIIRACQKVFGATDLTVMLESHGRESVVDLNVSRTTGWFTTLYPVHIQEKADLAAILRELSSIPMNGIGYGVLRYFDPAANRVLTHKPSIRVNYLGQPDLSNDERSVRVVQADLGSQRSPDDERPYVFDVVAFLHEGKLGLYVSYSMLHFSEPIIERFKLALTDFLMQAIDEGSSIMQSQKSSFALHDIEDTDLENFFDENSK